MIDFLTADDLRDSKPTKIGSVVPKELYGWPAPAAYLDDYSKLLLLDQRNIEFLKRLSGSSNPQDWVGIRVWLEPVPCDDRAERLIRLREPHR